MGECKECPAGHYCAMLEDSGATEALECPAVFYCEHGTSQYGLTPCPVGTYGNARTAAEADCMPCDEGFYCPRAGMAAVDPAFKCMDGYICNPGSESATGTDLCPVDKWCAGGE